MTYQIEVRTVEGWTVAHPRGGAPYQYGTPEEAARAARSLYPEWHRLDRVAVVEVETGRALPWRLL